MSSYSVAAIVFICVFGAAIFGRWLGFRLPDHHRSQSSHDAVKLVTGMVSVVVALVLGLLISSVKSSFDATDAEVRGFAATLIRLNETLGDYGPQADPIRDRLRRYTARAIADVWRQDKTTPLRIEDTEAGALLDRARLAISELPQGDARHAALRGDALSLAETALETRWLLIERPNETIKPVFLDILIAWTVMIFFGFGYNAPRNATVVTAFGAGAMALALCVFLIVEMDTPWSGLIVVSSRPMRDALAHISNQARVDH